MTTRCPSFNGYFHVLRDDPERRGKKRMHCCYGFGSSVVPSQVERLTESVATGARITTEALAFMYTLSKKKG